MIGDLRWKESFCQKKGGKMAKKGFFNVKKIFEVWCCSHPEFCTTYRGYSEQQAKQAVLNQIKRRIAPFNQWPVQNIGQLACKIIGCEEPSPEKIRQVLGTDDQQQQLLLF
jgi:hypothetical protein